MFKGRTDLQVEEVNLGFKYEIDKIVDGMNIKKCNLDEKSAKIIGKNIGIYYTIDDIDYYKKSKKIINEIANILNELFDEMKEIHNILIVGLGNKDITPDSLGPLVIHNIEVNRHLEKEKKYSVSALEPGVMGKTGMESSEIIKAIVSKIFEVETMNDLEYVQWALSSMISDNYRVTFIHGGNTVRREKIWSVLYRAFISLDVCKDAFCEEGLLAP